MPVDPKRLQSIFLAALEASDRPALLERECAGDVELRQRVDRLLAAHDDSRTLPGAPGRTGAYTPIAETVGSKIGPYVVREQIGEGGFGLVFVAEQTEPVKRKVALKVIKPGMDSRQVITRFEAERQALAMMDHPNIARVLDAGATESGRPYFVMELVRGIPITEYCDKNQLAPKERLELFIAVCQAIQHAHQKGIIHRDVKPSNVLVTSHDGKPVAKVIDFGVAKAIHQQLTDRSIYTNFATMVGTPLYMSPEQAEMSGLDIDTRSDIYSLGVLLYELLTGTTPLDRKKFAKAAYDEVRRLIREEEAPKPSTRLSSTESIASIAAQRQMEPAKLSKFMRGDLDWITMKCLEKDRTRRYETANGLARDIQRYLSDEPVEASPPSALYGLSKFTKKNKAALTTAASIMLLLVIGVTVSTWQAVRASKAEAAAVNAQRAESERAEGEKKERQRAEAGEKLAGERLTQVAAERDAKEKARQDAEAITKFLIDVLQSPDPSRNSRTITVAEKLDRAAKELKADRSIHPDLRAALLLTLGQTYQSLGLHQQAIPLQEQARALCLTTSGPEDSNTHTAIHDLAISYHAVGRREEALRMREEVLTRYRMAYGPEHVRTINAMNALVISYQAAARREDALKLSEEVLTLRRKVNGPEHPATLTAMSSLAASYHYMARLNEALKLSEEVLTLRRKVSGREHPDTLMAMNNLAMAYFDAGRLEEALKLLEELLPLSRKVLGPEHPTTLSAMNNLAVSYAAAGRQEEALKLSEEVLTLNRKVHGPEHPDTLDAMNNLATSYFRGSRWEAALKLFEEVLPLLRKVLGPEHPNTLTTMYNLAHSYSNSGRKDEALKLLEEVLTLRRKVLGPEHPQTLGAMSDLAASCFFVGRREDALKMGEEVLTLRRKVLGPEHADTLTAMNNLASFFFEAGRRDEALQLGEEMLRLNLNANGPEHSNTLEAMNNLAHFYSNAGRRDEALKLSEEVLQIRRRVHGAEHPKTLRAMYVLASYYSGAGRREASLKLGEEALRLSRKVNGPDHPETLSAMTTLADSCFAVGKTEQALGFHREALTISRKLLPKESLQLADVLATFGDFLLKTRAFAEAESVLRECLSISEKTQPDHWRTFIAQSMLGMALLGQKKYADAEPLLLKGYEGTKQREKTIPPQAATLLPEALDRLIELYTATNKPDEVKKYTELLAKYPGTKKEPEKK